MILEKRNIKRNLKHTEITRGNYLDKALFTDVNKRLLIIGM